MEIGALVQKEFRQLKTNPRTLILIFMIPGILVVIFGLSTGGSALKFYNVSVISLDTMDNQMEINGTAVPNSSEYAPVFSDAIANQSQTFGLISDFIVNDTLAMQEALDESIKLIQTEELDVIVILPANFTECIQNHLNLSFQLHIDGSDLQTRDSIDTAIQEPIFRMIVQIIKDNPDLYNISANFTMNIPTFEYDVPS